MLGHYREDSRSPKRHAELGVTFKGPYVDCLLDIGTCRLKAHWPIHERVRVLTDGEHVSAPWSTDAHVLGF